MGGADLPEEERAPAVVAHQGDHSLRGNGLRTWRQRGSRSVIRGACGAFPGGRWGRASGGQRAVELLDEQLGASPAPETRALHERLRSGEEA